MTKKKLPVRFTGQHFTIDKVLIKDAIRQANISNQDTVLDIGAGKGFLTVHLLKVGSINSIFYFLHKAAEPFNCLEQDNLA